jgi:hypothetical protein
MPEDWINVAQDKDQSRALIYLFIYLFTSYP